MPATHYDPDRAPDPSEWLAINEHDRIRLVQSYHVSARIKAPNLKAHSVIHAAVENQIATGYGPGCRAIERLQKDGLSRHDAIHAIGAVLAQFAYESLQEQRAASHADTQSRLNAAIEALTAAGWRSSGQREKDNG